jgi:hypothetical protein
MDTNTKNLEKNDLTVKTLLNFVVHALDRSTLLCWMISYPIFNKVLTQK